MLRYCLTEGEPPPPSTAATLLRIMNGKEESVHFHRCIRPPSPCCRRRRYTPTEPRRREGERGNVEAAGLHPVLPLPPPLPIVKASPENVADLPSLCRLIEEEKQGRHRGVHPPPPLGHVGRAGRTPPPYAVAQHRNHRHCYSTFRTGNNRYRYSQYVTSYACKDGKSMSICFPPIKYIKLIILTTILKLLSNVLIQLSGLKEIVERPSIEARDEVTEMVNVIGRPPTGAESRRK
nr:hypothetical protein Iba_chr04aCG17470 [Ipomoea batatas]